MKKKLILSNLLITSSLLFGQEIQTTISQDKMTEVEIAAEEIRKINEMAKSEQKINAPVKSESQIKQEKEEAAKILDTRKTLDLNIYSAKKLLKSIDTVYQLTDVKFVTLGNSYFLIDNKKLNTAISHLRKSRQLKDEISLFLSTVSSSENLESEQFLNNVYNQIQQTYTTWLNSRKTIYDENNEYQGGVDEEKVKITSEGYVANGIKAKRVRNYIELSID